jgi:2,4-dienoyl-CoA reductase-like NADH-dependent reductase (Old Yellow Enzyme family)
MRREVLSTVEGDAVQFPRLFEPLKIGPLTARNRVVLGAHFTLFGDPNPVWGEPGFYGERYSRYLADRARGGAGVIIAGQAHVHQTSAYQILNNTASWKEEAIPGLRLVAEAIQRHGALAFIQISHNGAAAGSNNWSKLPLMAPSGLAVRVDNPKTLERSEIREIVAGYGRTAANAAAGGFDGIEVHGAHGYLIAQFLSPVTNRRTDEYGGSLENRMRFMVEVLREVRKRAGSRVAVGLRLTGDEERPNGLGIRPQDAAEVSALLEELQVADFINVSIGQTGRGMVRPLYVPHLVGVYAASTVKEAVSSTPVFAVHRILTPGEAEGILERGDADAVTLVRALITDPEWALKASTNRASEIRLCTGCNQSCYNHLVQSLPMACAHNPAVGREAELGLATLEQASAPRRVVVVGGGPAGLEAAWVAAARGHEVILLERAIKLGGKIRLAELLPGRAEVADFADWRAAECGRKGVDLRLGLEASVESIRSLSPDLVVVATGGIATTDFPVAFYSEQPAGWELPSVVTHEAAVSDPDSVGRHVLVADFVGHVEGIGIAELLAAAGRSVVLSMPFAAPPHLEGESIGHALGRAVRAGVTWRPNTLIESVSEREVRLRDLLATTSQAIPADTVVVRTHGRPDDSLYFELQDAGLETVRVGDAVAPRPVDRAIFDGHLAGRRA